MSEPLDEAVAALGESAECIRKLEIWSRADRDILRALSLHQSALGALTIAIHRLECESEDHQP
jgi:hypothetical protein